MFVLGIDPGLSRCGYGVIEKTGQQNVAVALGVLRTPHSAPIHERLGELQRELRELIVEFKPNVVAVERVFFQVNASTAIGVAQAAGLAMAEASNAGCGVVEYTPNQVKEAVAGWGAASKDQIQVMVQSLLKMSDPPKPADAADALAVALCHLSYAPLQDKVTRATR